MNHLLTVHVLHIVRELARRVFLNRVNVLGSPSQDAFNATDTTAAVNASGNVAEIQNATSM
jgi:uridylate kinase